MFQTINTFRFFSIKRTRLLIGAGGTLAVLFCLFAVFAAQSAQAQAPNLVVTKTADTNDGVCDGDCSLREAIDVADSNGVPDIIGFNIPANAAGCAGNVCEIDMSLGNFAPAADGGNLITINGSGPNIITLDAQNLSRHFTIQAGRNLAINNLTLRRGNGTGALSNLAGGSIFINGAGSQLTLTNMTIRNNTAAGDGGGINSNNGSTLVMTNSTVSNNTAGSSSGGIGILGTAVGTLTNVTVSGNTSNNVGGGGICVFGAGASLSATSLTVTNNTSNFTNFNFGGGGILQDGSSNPINIRNSIVSGNTHPTSPDVDGAFVSGGYNFIGKNNGSNFVAGNPNANHDIVGTIAVPQDPQLQPLANNGGATQTHALLISSPAVDKGNSFGTTSDQRGFTRPVDTLSVANAPGGDGADIGAFELVTQVDLALSLVVSPDPVAPGGTSTYQMTLTNLNTDVAAQNVVLSQGDLFPRRGGTRLTIQSVSAPAGWTCGAPNPALGDSPTAEIVCRGASLGAGQTAQFTITKRQQTLLAPGTAINHEAQVSTETIEPNTVNNRATDTTTVQ